MCQLSFDMVETLQMYKKPYALQNIAKKRFVITFKIE